MIALLRQLSWPEVRHHPWRTLAALLAVMLGVALAYSVHLINESALGEFSAAVRSVNGEPDFELRGQRRGFDEALYARVARDPRVAIASPVVEIETAAFDAAGRRVPLRIVGVDALVAAFARAGAAAASALEDRPVRAARSGRDLPESAGRRALRSRRRPTRPAGADRRPARPSCASPAAVDGERPAARGDGHRRRAGELRLARPAQPHRRAPRARRRSRRDCCATLPLPAGVRAAAPDEASTAHLQRLARLPRQPHRARAGGAVHRRVPRLLDPRAVGRAAPAAARAARRARPRRRRSGCGLVLAESALLGAVGSALGLLLGAGLAALALRAARRRPRRRLLPRRRADVAASTPPGPRSPTARSASPRRWSAAGCRHDRPAHRTGAGAEGPRPGAPSARRRLDGPSLLALGCAARALLPAIGGIPLAAYLSVACLLVGGIACVPAGIGLLLRAAPHPRHPLALLAIERARHERHERDDRGGRRGREPAPVGRADRDGRRASAAR